MPLKSLYGADSHSIHRRLWIGWVVKCHPIEWHLEGRTFLVLPCSPCCLEGYPVLGPPCSTCRLKGCPVLGHPCSPWEWHPNRRLQGYGVLPTPCSSCERVLLHLVKRTWSVFCFGKKCCGTRDFSTDEKCLEVAIFLAFSRAIAGKFWVLFWVLHEWKRQATKCLKAL